MTMNFTEEHKRKVLEQIDKFVSITKEINAFEEKIESLKQEHLEMIKTLENAREEEKLMIESFNLDEEGKESYNKFVQDILLKQVKLS